MSAFIRMLWSGRQRTPIVDHGRMRLGLSERDAQDAVRPRTGRVDASLRNPPIKKPAAAQTRPAG